MEITKDERELYDRQIRLWGLEGQNRLRNARILVIGMSATAVELVKNLCLAGVGSVTLQSTEAVQEDDHTYNFFLSRDADGNAALASVQRIQELNPRVNVNAETRSIDELDNDYLGSFDVLVVTQLLDRVRLVILDEVVRQADCAFYCAILQGWGGFLFVDLGKHEFVIDNGKPLEVGKVSESQTVVSSQRAQEEGTATAKLTIREEYSSLEQALEVKTDFGTKIPPRQRKKVSPYLPAFLALLENPEKPNIRAKAAELGLPEQLITQEFADQFIAMRGVQISGMASIIGGTLSQEVINFLTMREYPIQNVHVYDGLDGKGPQYYLSSK